MSQCNIFRLLVVFAHARCTAQETLLAQKKADVEAVLVAAASAESHDHIALVKNRLEQLTVFASNATNASANVCDRICLSPASAALRNDAATTGTLKKNAFKDYTKRLARYAKSLDNACDGLEALVAQDCHVPAISFRVFTSSSSVFVCLVLLGLTPYDD